jgi:hypothetical protein
MEKWGWGRREGRRLEDRVKKVGGLKRRSRLERGSGKKVERGRKNGRGGERHKMERVIGSERRICECF